MNNYKIGELLTRIKDVILVEDNIEYKRITIKSKNQGVYLRDIVKGSKIGTKRQFLARKGQFIMSRIDARNGAFGIIPPDLEGAIMTNDFLTFEVNHELVNIDYFNMLTESSQFMKYCIDGSKGTTNRKRLKEELFLNFEITIPSKKEQDIIMKQVKNIKEYSSNIDREIKIQERLISTIRLNFIDEAIKGNLSIGNSNDESVDILLDRIKNRKEELINSKKIRKEKVLSQIKDDEVLFPLKHGWKWVRLGEVISIKGGKRVPAGYKLLDSKTSHIYIRVTDMKNDTILTNDLKYISDDIYEGIKNYTVSAGDLYITIAGTIGRVGIVPDFFEGMNLSENACRVIPHFVNNKYLLNVLKSSIVQNQFKDKTNKVGQPKLALTRILDTVIPLAPLEEQYRIVEKLDYLMSICDNLQLEKNNLKSISSDMINKILNEISN